jgi:hypothetical protein
LGLGATVEKSTLESASMSGCACLAYFLVAIIQLNNEKTIEDVLRDSNYVVRTYLFPFSSVNYEINY